MKRIENTGANLNHGQKTELLRRWFTESEKSKEEANSEKYHWEEDQPVAEWLNDQLKAAGNDHDSIIKDNLKMMRVESMMGQFRNLVKQMNDDELHEAGIYLTQQLTKKEDFVEAVRKIATEDATTGDKIETGDKNNTNKSETEIDKEKAESSSASENGDPE